MSQLDKAKDDYDELTRAIRNEQHVYGDLVTHEIPVIDSYYTLVEKTSYFMNFLVANYEFKYVMMVDDDVYLKLDDLVAGLKGREGLESDDFYAGQVWQKMYSKSIKPNRDPKHRNYLR